MSEPDNLMIIDDIEIASGMEVEPYFIAQRNISIVLDKLYGKKATMEAVEDFEIQHAAEYGNEEDEEEE